MDPVRYELFHHPKDRALDGPEEAEVGFYYWRVHEKGKPMSDPVGPFVSPTPAITEMVDKWCDEHAVVCERAAEIPQGQIEWTFEHANTCAAALSGDGGPGLDLYDNGWWSIA